MDGASAHYSNQKNGPPMVGTVDVTPPASNMIVARYGGGGGGGGKGGAKKKNSATPARTPGYQPGRIAGMGDGRGRDKTWHFDCDWNYWCAARLDGNRPVRSSRIR